MDSGGVEGVAKVTAEPADGAPIDAQVETYVELKERAKLGVGE